MRWFLTLHGLVSACRCGLLPAGMLLLVEPAQAHEVIEGAEATRLPIIFSELLLVAFWLAYCAGARRVRPTAGRWLAFQGGSLIAGSITFGPLDGWIESGSAKHMIQHLLIMAVIAPLYVAARPLPQWASACGRSAIRLFKPLLRLSRYPLGASGLQAVMIWFWHAPKFYNLALASPWWHFVEHVCFALGAGIFWWSVLNRRSATAFLALLFTFMHMGLLGALLSFAQTPLYDDLRDIQDQQLAGLIMWVPGGMPYLIVSAWCGLRWFQRAARTECR